MVLLLDKKILRSPLAAAMTAAAKTKRGGPQERKKGPTLHRPMTHPIVFRYLSYSTEQNMLFITYDGVQPLAGMGHVCSCLFNEMV